MQVNPGKKGDETKAEIIKKSYGFSKKQYIDIQKLTAESVKEAKELAKQKGKIVTRNDALKLLKLKHKVKNNTEFVHNTGIYETINLPTHNPERITNPINYCVLFANVGIGEYYLEENGFHAVVANEYLPERAKCFLHLHHVKHLQLQVKEIFQIKEHIFLFQLLKLLKRLCLNML